jgi:hypothetical protein
MLHRHRPARGGEDDSSENDGRRRRRRRRRRTMTTTMMMMMMVVMMMTMLRCGPSSRRRWGGGCPTASSACRPPHRSETRNDGYCLYGPHQVITRKRTMCLFREWRDSGSLRPLLRPFFVCHTKSSAVIFVTQIVDPMPSPQQTVSAGCNQESHQRGDPSLMPHQRS